MYMRRAIELAERGFGRVAPNPLVGAVLVRDGAIVGEGWHREYGSAHAEVEAIEAAGDRATGATLYVSLEPCAHHGKTPPCTEAILAAGIRRVVFAASDPTSAASGGAEFLRSRGIDAIGGVEEGAAMAINRPFFRASDPKRSNRPWTELKLALSLDGRIADRDRRSHWITGLAAREEVHRLRAGNDAIAIGVGTAIADDPLLTVRGAVEPRVPPVRVVFDRTLRLPTEGRLVRTAREIPTWVVCSPGAPGSARADLETKGVEIIAAVDLHTGLEQLRDRGLRSMFVEGGAELAGSLLRDDLVDRLTLFYAPLLLGPDAVDPFRCFESRPLSETRRWTVLKQQRLGEDTLIILED